VSGGMGLRKEVKTTAGHGKGNRIQYGGGKRRECERQKGTYWIGGSKEAIDKRASGALSDACAKLAVGQCTVAKLIKVYILTTINIVSCACRRFEWWI
jgi:hypothetical protein